MKLLGLLGLLIGGMLLVGYLFPKWAKGQGDEALQLAPELGKTPADQRGELWINTLAKVLLEWPYILLAPIGLACSMLVPRLLFPHLSEMTLNLIGAGLAGGIVALSRPFILKRAREHLEQNGKQEGKGNNADNN